jgi:hypothetical protein
LQEPLSARRAPTSPYLAEISDDVAAVADILDRRHQGWRRDLMAA